jgi:hypothetical protein
VVEIQTKANQQLNDVAAKAGYSVPESLDTKHHARVDKLAKLSGAEFDKAYIKDQVKENEMKRKSGRSGGVPGRHQCCCEGFCRPYTAHFAGTANDGQGPA